MKNVFQTFATTTKRKLQQPQEHPHQPQQQHPANFLPPKVFHGFFSSRSSSSVLATTGHLQSVRERRILQMSDEGRASRLNYQTFSAEKIQKTDQTITSQKLTMRQSIQVIRGGTSSATRRISSSTFKKKRGVKFTLRFSRKAPILPRFSKLCEARSRLHRRRCLQVDTRWKALAEIYTMHSFAPFSWDPSG